MSNVGEFSCSGTLRDHAQVLKERGEFLVVFLCPPWTDVAGVIRKFQVVVVQVQ